MRQSLFHASFEIDLVPLLIITSEEENSASMQTLSAQTKKGVQLFLQSKDAFSGASKRRRIANDEIKLALALGGALEIHETIRTEEFILTGIKMIEAKILFCPLQSVVADIHRSDFGGATQRRFDAEATSVREKIENFFFFGQGSDFLTVI